MCLITHLGTVMYRVVVAGLGRVGKPVAEYLIKRGHKVYGYDIRPLPLPYATTDWNSIPHQRVDVYIVAVWTGLDEEGRPDMSAVEDVVSKVASSNPNALVTIESTIVPGTSRRLHEKYGVPIAHCPHRYWAVDPVHYGVRQLRVLGAVSREALARALDFYQSIDIPVFVVSSVEIAELSKIVENAYRYLTIAFAENVRLLAEAMNLEFWELRQAVNTKFNVDLPEARRGIKGHCLPKDVTYFQRLLEEAGVPSDLIDGAVKVDKEYVKYIEGMMPEG